MELSLAGKKVLVGIDFSGSSESALLHAVSLAERELAQLELVHVFEWDAPSGEDTGPAGLSMAQGYLQALARAARQRLAEICSSLVGDRVPAEIQVRIGDPAKELHRAAEQAQAALAVLGMQGRRKLAQGAVGRTADRICRSSSVPVLLVAPRSAPAEGQVLLRSARGQILWNDSPLGAVRHRVAAGHFQPGPRRVTSPPVL
jgi:nucleotide-binding universal stress UspA family protein